MHRTTFRKKQVSQRKHHHFPFSDTSGQISLDFIAGTVIFMVTFMFLFQTLTSLFVPFQSSSDEVKSMSDRVAKTLVESTAGLANSPTETNIISISKAQALDSDMDTASGYSSVLEDMGLSSETRYYNLNVSLYDLDNTVYTNATGGVVLNNGPVPPQNTNVAQTIRVVYVEQDDEIAILYVKVW